MVMKKLALLLMLLFVLSISVSAYDVVEVHTFDSVEEVYDDMLASKEEYHQNKIGLQGFTPSGLYPGPHKSYSAKYVSQSPVARYHYEKSFDQIAEKVWVEREDFPNFYVPYHYYWR